ncbi:684_t:CDS:1, partial [Paraglomus brasilianum]
MDTAQLKQEFEKASAKSDRLEALRNGATERYVGERTVLENQEAYWLGEKKKWGDVL